MEASCGKNPVYHTGKLFSAIGDLISKKIYDKYNVENVVYCTSKVGDQINNPWNISVELNTNVPVKIKHEINNMVKHEIKKHIEITDALINRDVKLNSY